MKSYKYIAIALVLTLLSAPAFSLIEDDNTVTVKSDKKEKTKKSTISQTPAARKTYQLSDTEIASKAFGKLLHRIDHWNDTQKDITAPNEDTLAISLIQRFGNDPRIMVGIAKAYDTIPNFRYKAMQYADMAIKTHPEFAGGYTTKADLISHYFAIDPKDGGLKKWVSRDSIDAAIALYETAIEKSPRDTIGYSDYARFVISPLANIDNAAEKALAIYEKMQINIPEYPVNLYKGRLFYEIYSNMADSALTAANEIKADIRANIIPDSTNFVRYTKLATSYYREAHASYAQIFADKRELLDDADLISYSAMCWTDHEYDKAIEVSLYGKEKYPEVNTFNQELMLSYRDSGNYSEAVKCGEEFFAHPDTVEHRLNDYFEYAQTLQKAKMYDKAIVNYVKCKQIAASGARLSGTDAGALNSITDIVFGKVTIKQMSADGVAIADGDYDTPTAYRQFTLADQGLAMTVADQLGVEEASRLCKKYLDEVPNPSADEYIRWENLYETMAEFAMEPEKTQLIASADDILHDAETLYLDQFTIILQRRDNLLKTRGVKNTEPDYINFWKHRVEMFETVGDLTDDYQSQQYQYDCFYIGYALFREDTGFKDTEVTKYWNKLLARNPNFLDEQFNNPAAVASLKKGYKLIGSAPTKKRRR